MNQLLNLPAPSIHHRASIRVEDGMLIVHYGMIAYTNTHENIRVTDLGDGRVQVESDQQRWVCPIWDEYDKNDVHPDAFDDVEEYTERVGFWPWNRRTLTRQRLRNDMLRLHNRPRRFVTTAFTFIQQNP